MHASWEKLKAQLLLNDSAGIKKCLDTLYIFRPDTHSWKKHAFARLGRKCVLSFSHSFKPANLSSVSFHLSLSLMYMTLV